MTTRPTSKAPFTPQGVCEIIKECGLAGVRHFSYLGLEIHFDKATEVHHSTAPWGGIEVTDPGSFEVEEQKNIAVLGEDLKMQELENLRLNDPVAYEERILSGELTPNTEDEDAREKSY